MVEATAKADIKVVPHENRVEAETQKPGTADPTKVGGTKIITAPFQIIPMQEREKWLKMIVYGKHGAGKTELLCTAADVPQMRDVLMINIDKGDMVMHDSPRIQNPEKIWQIPIDTMKQIGPVHDWLKAYLRFQAAKEDNKLWMGLERVYGLSVQELKVKFERPPYFRTIIIDSLTELDSKTNQAIVGIDTDKMMKGDMSDLDVAGWPEFRKNNEMVKLLVKAYRDLPVHVLCTAADTWTKDQHGKMHYAPYLTGKLGTQVQGLVDVVGWLVVGAMKEDQHEAPRRLYVQPIDIGRNFDAKNRRAVYQEAWFDDASMTTIMDGFKLLNK